MPKIFYVEDNDDNVYAMRGRLPRLGSRWSSPSMVSRAW